MTATKNYIGFVSLRRHDAHIRYQKEREDMELFLKKEIIFDKSFSDEAVSAYVALRGIASYSPENEYITASHLAFVLTGIPDEGSYKETLIKSLNKGVLDLCQMGVTSVNSFLSFGEYALDISNTSLDTQSTYFIKADLENIRHIFKSAKRTQQQTKLLRYYLCMIGYLKHDNALGKYKGRIGETPLSLLASSVSISTRSAIRYNNLLTSQKIIYIYHSPKFKTTNIYSRYSDLALCIEYGKNKDRKEN